MAIEEISTRNRGNMMGSSSDELRRDALVPDRRGIVDVLPLQMPTSTQVHCAARAISHTGTVQMRLSRQRRHAWWWLCPPWRVVSSKTSGQRSSWHTSRAPCPRHALPRLPCRPSTPIHAPLPRHDHRSPLDSATHKVAFVRDAACRRPSHLRSSSCTRASI